MAFKLVDLDLDGTLLCYNSEFNSSWDDFYRAANLVKESKDLLNYYLWKKPLYNEWFNKQVLLLKGKSVSEIESEILPPTYMEGAENLSQELKSMGLIRGLLTSGVDIIARYVEKDLNLDFCECNEVFQENGFFTGLGKSNVNLWDKKRNLLKICKQFNVKPKEVVVVGDHENELELFEIAGLGIAYQPKTDNVTKAADYVVNNLVDVVPLIRDLNKEMRN